MDNKLYFEDVLKRRYSTRRFKDDKVSNEDIMKILEMGRIAPTAKNNQPQRIYVVTKDEDLLKVDKASRCRYNAPLVFIICSDTLESWKDDKGRDSYEIDASIVATHMMLEATNLGIDNIWIGMYDKEILRNEFNIPKSQEIVALLPMGYSDTNPSNLHNTRKNMGEMVIFL